MMLLNQLAVCAHLPWHGVCEKPASSRCAGQTAAACWTSLAKCMCITQEHKGRVVLFIPPAAPRHNKQPGAAERTDLQVQQHYQMQLCSAAQDMLANKEDTVTADLGAPIGPLRRPP